MIYLPKFAFHIINKYEYESRFHIKHIQGISWHPGFEELNTNIKYFIEYAKIPISTIGFNMIEVINYLNNTGIIPECDLNLDNIRLHISGNNWNFYYPREYENTMEKNIDRESIFTLDEYWIKEIIE